MLEVPREGVVRCQSRDVLWVENAIRTGHPPERVQHLTNESRIDTVNRGDRDRWKLGTIARQSVACIVTIATMVSIHH